MKPRKSTERSTETALTDILGVLRMDDDFDYEAHERLRDRTANITDSTLWTFKAYYLAADHYKKYNRYSDWAVFGIAGLLTISLIWDSIPQIVLVGLAIGTAVISGYRRMANPDEKVRECYRAAHAYQRLFDDFRDFIKLELANKEIGLEEMKGQYRELSERRKNLNEDMPELTSKWYDQLDESVYEEVGTTKEAKQRLAGEAKLKDLDREPVDEDVKERLTGSAKLKDEELGVEAE